MSTTHTPKSLLFVSLGIGIALLLIVFPVWFGNNRDIVDAIEVQDAPQPALSLAEEQSEATNSKPVIELSAPENPSQTITDDLAGEGKKVRSIQETSDSESDVQSSEDDVEIVNQQVSSTGGTLVPIMDEKARRVENVGRLNENLQNRANSFIGENQIRNISKLSLEEKTAAVNNVDDFTQKTVNRIEDFLNKRP